MRPILCAIPGCQGERIDSQPFCVNHAKTGAGRPKEPKPRNMRVFVRFTAEEYFRLLEAAQNEGVELATLVRLALAEIIHPNEIVEFKSSAEVTKESYDGK